MNNSNPSRFFALDALRGLIMVFMALDHANFFVAQQHSSGEYWGGHFPEYTDVLTFLTRFITHFSAPGFFFLMGVGMFLFADSRRERGWTDWEIVKHFLIRGGALILLQLLIVNRAWPIPSGEPAQVTYIGVLFALGGTMILGSLLLRLDRKVLVVLAIVLFVGMEILSPDPGQWGQIPANNAFGEIDQLLITPGGSQNMWSNYPIFPWLELVVFGLVFGSWLVEDVQKTYQTALKLGAVFIALFIVLRTLDGFGNIRPRQTNTWIGFLNVVKYPPAMTFTLMTMGVNLTLLNLFSKIRGPAQRYWKLVVVFGRTPLFFYVVHLFLYALLGRIFAPNGTSVPAMYPYWVLGLVILYPLCLWYGKYKREQASPSILRFL